MTFLRPSPVRHTFAVGALALLCAVSACSDEPADAEPTVHEASSTTAPVDPDAANQTTPGDDARASTAAGDVAATERTVETAADGTYLISGDQASFVMPSGNIQCVMRAGSVVCQISQKQFEPAQEDLSEAVLGDCGTTSADALTLLDDDVAAWTCTSETIRGQASVDLGGWWAAEGVGETERVEGQDLAVLRYGQSMQLGSMLCTSRSSGISCRDTASPAGFTLAREDYSVS